MKVAPLRFVSVDPAGLFVELWMVASVWRSSHLTAAKSNNASRRSRLREILETTPLHQINQSIVSVIENTEDTRQFRGAMLDAMREIDEIFFRIHPRSVNLSTSIAPRPSVPEWLKGFQEHRDLHGVYASFGERNLVPRGPLTRRARSEVASYGEHFPDRFSSLTVVPEILNISGTPVRILHSVKGTDAARGVTRSNNMGGEKVLFIPIAEASKDIIFKDRQDDGRHYVDYRAAEHLSVPKIILDVLARAGVSDIAMAPELLVSEVDADSLCDQIVQIDTPPRVLMCGSGQTTDSEDGQAWNEARVINGSGTALWRQRKLWQAGIDKESANHYGIPHPENGLVYEDNCSGEEVHVVDLDGFGRSVILICQDFEAKPLADELISQLQPDWVFTPILDSGIDVGRWGHQRAFALSATSQTRYLIASSTTLAELKGKPGQNCGMAVGPRDATEEDAGRLYALAKVSKKTLGYGVLTWRSGEPDWKKTSLK